MSAEVSEDPATSPYVRVVDEFEQSGIDVCYVDDEHRPACMREAIPRINSGGLLILDDSQLFLDRAALLNNDRNGNGDSPHNGGLTAEWGEIAALLRDWRMIWSSDGASDAAIWIKP
jgi:hypothetical protein